MFGSPSRQVIEYRDTVEYRDFRQSEPVLRPYGLPHGNLLPESERGVGDSGQMQDRSEKVIEISGRGGGESGARAQGCACGLTGQLGHDRTPS